MSDTSLIFNLVARDQASATIARMQDRINTAAAGIGAGAAAGLGVGLVQGLDLEAATDKMSAQLAVGPEKAAQLSKVAADVYEDAWGDSADTVAQAVSGVYRNIGDVSGVKGGIKGVTTQVLALAQTYDQDLGGVTAAVGQMMKTGLAKNADEALDIIAVGMSKGVNKADDFLDTLNEYGTQFRDLGLNGAQATGILRQGLKAGARDADVVADAMKELNIRVKDGTAAEGLKKLGLNADQMADAFATGGPEATAALQKITDRLRGIKDPSDRARMAQALLGTQSEDLSKALYAINPSTATKGLGELSGAAEKMTKTVGDNPKAALEKFKRAATTELGEIAGKFMTFSQENSAVMKPLLFTLAGIAAAILLIKAGMMAWSAALAVWTAAKAIATAAQWLWNAAMAANPVTWIILAIIALIAIVVLLVMKWDWVKAKLLILWDKIKAGLAAGWQWMKKNVFQPIGDFFTKKIPGWAEQGIQWLKDKWDGLVDFVTGLPEKMHKASRGMFNGIMDSFKSAVNWLIEKWNSFSLTIGGGSVLGFDIPSVTLHTPNIPYLAKGGNIMRGGTAVVGEAGPELISMPRGAQVTPLTGGAGGGAVRVVFDVQGADADMKRMIRKMVRVDGGGNVQVAFGRE